MATDAISSLALLAVQSDVSVALLVFAGVVVSSVGAFVIAKRTHSGQIRDSEAAKLWDESTQMRVELRKELEAKEAENRELRAELAKCRGQRVRNG